MTATEIRKQLHKLASKEIAASSARYFKTGPGEYGEGDVFIGIRVPVLRTLSRTYRDLAIDLIHELLISAIHEERLFALLVLGLQFKRGNEDTRTDLYDFYREHIAHINNWDLVDTSAPTIVGAYLIDKSKSQLTQWSKSSSLWERRIAIVSTQYFIRQGEYRETLRLSRLLLRDPEDLIHKATGWMLREVGERERETLLSFLEENGARMPRTMLRYAIEKLTPHERKAFLELGRS